jgi:hypothetical protein
MDDDDDIEEMESSDEGIEEQQMEMRGADMLFGFGGGARSRGGPP